MYDWNVEGTFDWYVRESGLNAVELNSSFYRLPFRNQVAAWSKKSASLRWAVKVHRYVTHMARLSDKALEFWERFSNRFEPLEDKIDFYLIQLPPSFALSDGALERIRKFLKVAGDPSRVAIEFRNPSWFSLGSNELCQMVDGAVVVSVDSPQGTWVANCGGTIYMRLHGRASWYWHDYSASELEEIARLVMSLKPSRVYAFFNNDHWMLKNAREMLKLLASLC